MNPALTAEEWASGEGPSGALQFYVDLDHGVVDVRIDEARHRHALAALLLDGQPFGFTKEDVRAVLDAADAIRYNQGYVSHRKLEAIADRIEALLPPEST